MRNLSRNLPQESPMQGHGDREGFKAWLLDESGATVIEYALVASLIAMVALVGFAALGIQVGILWNGVAAAATGAM